MLGTRYGEAPAADTEVAAVIPNNNNDDNNNNQQVAQDRTNCYDTDRRTNHVSWNLGGIKVYDLPANEIQEKHQYCCNDNNDANTNNTDNVDIGEIEVINAPLDRQPVNHLSKTQQLQYFKVKSREFQRKGKHLVYSLDTYQGRKQESINGCTVIASLIMVQHLQNPDPMAVMSNRTIGYIIDEQCGPILQRIRYKFGIRQFDFILLCDVHDHLVDENLLSYKQFYGVAGGNIMNKNHMDTFLQLLSDDLTYNGKKGATFIFHGHVVAILKGIDAISNKPFYEFIDSMPPERNVRLLAGTRIRCIDIASLEVAILLYAIWKLPDTVDIEWDDNKAATDPRVFQGCIWSGVDHARNVMPQQSLAEQDSRQRHQQTIQR